MTDQTTIALIDTNILVYQYDPSDRYKQDRASQIVDTSHRRGAAISVQVLGEMYWALVRKIQPRVAPADASRSVNEYLRSWPVYHLTTDIVSEALRGCERFQLPYWDSLIWATAKMNHVPLVISEDFSHGSYLDNVRFLNPFTLDFSFPPPGADV
ncbi:MAG: PIN domain-containing protein [Chloroflexota bacterium]